MTVSIGKLDARAVTPYTALDVRRRAVGKLWSQGDLAEVLNDAPARRSDYDLNPDMRRELAAMQRRQAAVLVPIVNHQSGATVLLTKRTEDLPTHPGQVAFPGGKVESHDVSPVHAALREAHEEIGLEPDSADVIGYLDPYETGTGFRILPVVAVVEPGLILKPDPTEVAEAFEVPLEFLMQAENHKRHSREWQGTLRRYYAMPYGDYYIWGATAGMLRNLYEWLYE